VSLDAQRFDMIIGEAAIVEVVWTIKAATADRPITGAATRESAQGSGIRTMPRPGKCGRWCQPRNCPTVGNRRQTDRPTKAGLNRFVDGVG
jgi:hypothetical protein